MERMGEFWPRAAAYQNVKTETKMIESRGAEMLRHPGYFVHRDPDGNYHIKENEIERWEVLAWSGLPAWAR